MKRKRVVLSIKDKLEIINKLEQGSSTKELSVTYGVGETTVRDIRKTKDKIIKFASSSDSSSGHAKRKTMKTSTYEALDKAMLEWFSQKRAEGIQVSGIICAKQAQHFFELLGLEGDFNASSGWLTRFKNRHGIREISVQGEKLSGDQEAASEFATNFQNFIADANLKHDQIYNADESGLFWKCMPTKTLAFQTERGAPGHKSSKERLTVMCCANASGTYKLKLCVVGKAKNPRSFKGTAKSNLPVTYYNQKAAWMDRVIFKNWFDHNFVPQVREHLKSIGLPERAVLLLDNAPSHPNENVLKSDDGQIFVKYLPPNVTALIQPMDQGVIAAMKKVYRGNLLQKHIDEGSNLKMFLKQFTVLDAIYGVAKAWEMVKPTTISKSWKKIIPEIEEEDLLGFEDTPFSASNLASALKDAPDCENVDSENIEEWFAVDCTLPGHVMLSDDEIVKRALGENDDCSDESEDDDSPLIPEKRICHSSALEWTENLLDYLEQQDDSLMSDKLMLRKLRSTLRKKEAASLKQKSIKDFFGSIQK